VRFFRLRDFLEVLRMSSIKNYNYVIPKTAANAFTRMTGIYLDQPPQLTGDSIEWHSQLAARIRSNDIL
jgi:hypothetical protein